jgi:putative endopeptidase
MRRMAAQPSDPARSDAVDALRRARRAGPRPRAQPGRGRGALTAAQRFFLAWAQIRCENTTPQAARNQVHSDPHSPGRWRVDGVVRNMPEFAAAFGCRAGAAMAPATRCRLW